MKNKIFRFEGKINLNEGDHITISQWRKVREGVPYEALVIRKLNDNSVYESRTKSVPMINPIEESPITGKVKSIKEKFNIKDNVPIVLFMLE